MLIIKRLQRNDRRSYLFTNYLGMRNLDILLIAYENKCKNAVAVETQDHLRLAQLSVATRLSYALAAPRTF